MSSLLINYRSLPEKNRMKESMMNTLQLKIDLERASLEAQKKALIARQSGGTIPASEVKRFSTPIKPKEFVTEDDIRRELVDKLKPFMLNNNQSLNLISALEARGLLIEFDNNFDQFSSQFLRGISRATASQVLGFYFTFKGRLLNTEQKVSLTPDALRALTQSLVSSLPKQPTAQEIASLVDKAIEGIPNAEQIGRAVASAIPQGPSAKDIADAIKLNSIQQPLTATQVKLYDFKGDETFQELFRLDTSVLAQYATDIGVLNVESLRDDKRTLINAILAKTAEIRKFKSTPLTPAQAQLTPLLPTTITYTNPRGQRVSVNFNGFETEEQLRELDKITLELYATHLGLPDVGRNKNVLIDEIIKRANEILRGFQEEEKQFEVAPEPFGRTEVSLGRPSGVSLERPSGVSAPFSMEQFLGTSEPVPALEEESTEPSAPPSEEEEKGYPPNVPVEPLVQKAKPLTVKALLRNRLDVLRRKAQELGLNIPNRQPNGKPTTKQQYAEAIVKSGVQSLSIVSRPETRQRESLPPLLPFRVRSGRTFTGDEKSEDLFGLNTTIGELRELAVHLGLGDDTRISKNELIRKIIDKFNSIKVQETEFLGETPESTQEALGMGIKKRFQTPSVKVFSGLKHTGGSGKIFSANNFFRRYK